jgi:hypothetical protein
MGPPEIRYVTGGEGHVSADGLYRIKSQRGRIVFVKPGTDLTRYTQVMLDPVVVSYMGGPDAGRELTPKRMDLVKKYFDEAFQRELGNTSNYSVVQEPGAGTLRVTPRLTDLQVTAPQEPAGRSQVYVRSAGTVTLILELSDSMTHAPLVRAAQRSEIGDPSGAGYESNTTSNVANARVLFRHWAILLRQTLESVREIPAVSPEVDSDPSPAA